MSDIFDLFKKPKDYDSLTAWEQMIESWEKNFLGSNNDDFYNSLESDNSFDNSFDQNKDNKNNILCALFDLSLLSENFTCINERCMNFYIKNGQEDKISEKNIWNIQRQNDLISKPFLRFTLKQNLSKSDIKNLLYLLADCEFEIQMGGCTTFKLPKLLFIYLIVEKLSKQIDIFDVDKFLSLNTMDEIKKKIIKLTNDGSIINQKYYVKNSNDIYIDIPLLVDFFTYNLQFPIYLMQWHDVKYILKTPSHQVDKINNYISDITVMFEEIVFLNNEKRHEFAPKNFDLIYMNCSYEYCHNWIDNVIEFRDLFLRSKFIFVIIRPSKMDDLELDQDIQINTDIDVTQLPQIISVELEECYLKNYGVSSKKNMLINNENIWVGQFENLIIYGIAADGSNMKNWIKVQSECINSFEKFCLSKDKYGFEAFTNINLNNTEIYKIVDLSKIKINLSDTQITTNIEILIIDQNTQKISGGMTGITFSN